MEGLKLVDTDGLALWLGLDLLSVVRKRRLGSLPLLVMRTSKDKLIVANPTTIIVREVSLFNEHCTALSTSTCVRQVPRPKNPSIGACGDLGLAHTPQQAWFYSTDNIQTLFSANGQT